jgi:hypothetical protein
MLSSTQGALTANFDNRTDRPALLKKEASEKSMVMTMLSTDGGNNASALFHGLDRYSSRFR